MSAKIQDATPQAPPKANAHPTRTSSLLLASFAAVYILWGSTFFAIRIGVESLPPLVLAGLRHLSVGLVFYPVFRRVSGEKPTLTLGSAGAAICLAPYSSALSEWNLGQAIDAVTGTRLWAFVFSLPWNDFDSVFVFLFYAAAATVVRLLLCNGSYTSPLTHR